MHPQISAALEQFGQGAGMPGLGGGGAAPLTLRLGDERQLGFHPLADELLVTLAATPRGDSLGVAMQALMLCHQRHRWPLPLHAGLGDDGRLRLITRLPASACQLHALEQAVDFLLRTLTHLER